MPLIPLIKFKFEESSFCSFPNISLELILQSKQSSPSQKDRARDMLDAFRDKRDNV